MRDYAYVEWIKSYQLLVTAALAGILFLAWEWRFILAIFFGAYLLATIFLPLVDRIERRRVPRIIAVIVVYLAAFALIAGAMTPAVTIVVSQWQSFVAALSNFTSTLSQTGLLGNIDFSTISSSLSQRVLAAGGSITSGIIEAVAAVAISIYLLYDWRRMHDALATFFGKHASLVGRIEYTLGWWVRGQLMLSAAVGILVFAGLTLYGLKFAPALAIMAGVLELIPYAGPILAALPAVLIALNTSLMSALTVVGIYIIVDQIENHILVPLIMKNAVQLHPVVVILSILIGFDAMGIVGALLAVPFFSALWVTLKEFYPDFVQTKNRAAAAHH